ncbi:hypothetical protein [Paenibacillus sp. YPG26]|nr:hypothetical protein [Paenibacillus sp. YPG26]USB32048.1 hypothetical protein LDO05_11950 [Paenibacillus sp. YPG26]
MGYAILINGIREDLSARVTATLAWLFVLTGGNEANGDYNEGGESGWH